MATNYTDCPQNIADIMQYVVIDKVQCAKKILMAQKCFFYDTCSFRYHSNMEHPEYLFEYIKRESGIVVITRTIIMELASASHSLNIEYIEYLKKMHGFGIEILVIYEEDIFEVLNLYYTSNAKINRCLSVAVKVSKNATGTISDVLRENSGLRQSMMDEKNTDRTLFSCFFSEVRNHKESEDNLGEEMVGICIHMLSNILEPYDFKYIVFTDDKGAIRLINKVQNNIWTHLEIKPVSAMTTIKLAQKLYQQSIITKREQVLEIVSAGTKENDVKILASEEYDLEPQEKKMTCSELTDKIMIPNAIHIYS